MATLHDALNLALDYDQAGWLQEAERIYREVLRVAPDYPEALHLLGLNAHRQGRDDVALECMGRAVSLDSSQAHYHNNLGELYRRVGRTAESVECFRRAVELEPHYTHAYMNMGSALRSLGELDQALVCYQQAVALSPGAAEAHNALGGVWRAKGCLAEAEQAYIRATELRPELAEAHLNLGAVRYSAGRRREAAVCFERALELRPDFAEGHLDLGVIKYLDGRLDEAAANLRRAIALKPDSADAYSSLGIVLRDLGHYDDALACCRRAVELKPAMAEGHNNLGAVLSFLGRPFEAAAAYRQAIECRSDFPEVYNNLGNALRDQGQLDQAVVCLGRALELNPHYAEAHSYLLCTLQYRPGVTLAALREAHEEYDRMQAAPLAAPPRIWPNARSAERPLRVGFVSPDLYRHPVGYFVVGLFENLDPRSVEIYCYSDRAHGDELTARLRQSAARWRDTSPLADGQLVDQIVADRIDVLIDLAGHTSDNRLLAFAARPAPVQMTWAGYVGTTGLKAMDYILADKQQIPPGAEGGYVERVVRMPHDYICYEPPVYAPPVGPPPALRSPHVTFGCFNNPAKINSEVATLWGAILRRLPDSRLVLRYRGLDEPGTRDQYLRILGEGGVDLSRVELHGYCPHQALLAAYASIDIALDTFPYSGGLTTCEALWMGVPVVTLPGETFAGRHSLTHLVNVGLTETIAATPEEYVAKAAALAQDVPRLTRIREALRPMMAASAVCDPKRFAADFTEVLAKVWRDWASANA